MPQKENNVRTFCTDKLVNIGKFELTLISVNSIIILNLRGKR